MKSFFATLLLLAITAYSFSQSKNSFGLGLGVGNGIIQKQQLEGGPGYDLKTGISLGFHYERSLSKKLQLSTGLSWYGNVVEITPAVNPNVDGVSDFQDVSLLYIPVLVKFTIGKFFFLKGGLIADIDISSGTYEHVNKQSGMGAGLGIGASVPLTKKLKVDINPYLNWHGLALTSNDSMYPERVIDSGIRLVVLTH